MAPMDDNIIEATKLVIREPGGGRVRATLSAEPAGEVVLHMTRPDGATAVTIRVGREGEPEIILGDSNSGVVVSLSAVEVWARGSVAAGLHTAIGPRE